MLENIQAVAAQIRTVVVGKDPQIRLALTCFLAKGHLLIEDLPGVGYQPRFGFQASSIYQ
jgi:MoxR-like ATPase